MRKGFIRTPNFLSSKDDIVCGRKEKNLVCGFTLIELLVVISIISLLASVIVVNMQSSRSRARYAQMVEQLAEMQKALEIYFSDNNFYPNDVGPGADPPGLIPDYLYDWVDPPCPGWTYDWENWAGGQDLQISVRNSSNAIVAEKCIYQGPGMPCSDVAQWTNRTISCE